MQTEFLKNPQIPSNNITLVREAIESAGYLVEFISLIPEGAAHHIYRVTTQTGLTAIARFEKPGRGVGTDGIKRDFEFNGPLSLARERNLIDLVRDHAGLPAPRIYGLYENIQLPHLLVEELPGIHWSEYLKVNNYSKEAYLHSLGFIGADLAKAHGIKFDSFGDVLDRDSVYPGNIRSFARRISMIIEPKLHRAQQLAILNDTQLDSVKRILQTDLAILEEATRTSNLLPVLALTDMQPKNFLVDGQGKPSGWVDLEYCQAAPPSLDFYFLRWFLLNYFEGVSDQAENVFLKGYRDNGGIYNPEDQVNKRMEYLLSVNRLLQAVNEYHQLSDGIRDNWSEKFKQIMLDAIGDRVVNYQAIASVFSSWTDQPRFAT